MSAQPKACPYCGQPLLHEDAIAHLQQHRGLDDRGRSKELGDPEVLLDELQGEAESVAGLPDQSE